MYKMFSSRSFRLIYMDIGSQWPFPSSRSHDFVISLTYCSYWSVSSGSIAFVRQFVFSLCGKFTTSFCEPDIPFKYEVIDCISSLAWHWPHGLWHLPPTAGATRLQQRCDWHQLVFAYLHSCCVNTTRPNGPAAACTLLCWSRSLTHTCCDLLFHLKDGNHCIYNGD